MAKDDPDSFHFLALPGSMVWAVDSLFLFPFFSSEHPKLPYGALSEVPAAVRQRLSDRGLDPSLCSLFPMLLDSNNPALFPSDALAIAVVAISCSWYCFYVSFPFSQFSNTFKTIPYIKFSLKMTDTFLFSWLASDWCHSLHKRYPIYKWVNWSSSGFSDIPSVSWLAGSIVRMWTQIYKPQPFLIFRDIGGRPREVCVARF